MSHGQRTNGQRTASRAPRSLSIYRNATKTEFLKFFVYFSVCFLIITTMTSARRIRRLALAVIFTEPESLFGSLSDARQVDKIYGFWQSQYKAGSYGGPFINPNHRAGYLEIIILSP
jgi:hypothetical protein